MHGPRGAQEGSRIAGAAHRPCATPSCSAAAVPEGSSQAASRAEAAGAENAEEGSVAGPEGGSQAAPTALIVGVQSAEEGAAAGPEGGSEAAPTAEIVGVDNMEEDGRQAMPRADSAEMCHEEEQQTVVCCELV